MVCQSTSELHFAGPHQETRLTKYLQILIRVSEMIRSRRGRYEKDIV
jgi:hypothetical protein